MRWKKSWLFFCEISNKQNLDNLLERLNFSILGWCCCCCLLQRGQIKIKFGTMKYSMRTLWRTMKQKIFFFVNRLDVENFSTIRKAIWPRGNRAVRASGGEWGSRACTPATHKPTIYYYSAARYWETLCKLAITTK